MSGPCTLILAGREGELARALADDVEAALRSRFPEDLDIHRMKDVSPDARLAAGDADVAVARAERLPLALPADTVVAAYLPRGPVTDALLSDFSLPRLPPKARIATSNLRRRAMLLRTRGDLAIQEVRAEARERVRLWRIGEFDGVVTATASLRRLAIDEPFAELDPGVFVPSPGQGAVACLCKAGSRFQEFLEGIDHARTRAEVEVERAVLRGIGGDPGLPVGIHATLRGDSLAVQAVVLSLDGRRAVTLRESIAAKDALYHADEFGEKLRRMGSDVLLARARRAVA